METNSDYLTTKEAASVLKCTAALLAKYRCTKMGPPYLLVGRLVRYKRADVVGWAELRRVVPGATGCDAR
jgi:hypothetical protein